MTREQLAGRVTAALNHVWLNGWRVECDTVFHGLTNQVDLKNQSGSKSCVFL
jgi:hypothetical protein